MSKPTMPRTLSSKGFSVVELVIVLVVIAVLALGGFFVWQRMNDDKTDQKSGNNTSRSEDNKQGNQAQNEEEPADDPSEGGKYLVIVEWGVRFPLPESLRGDVEYGIVSNVQINEAFSDDVPQVNGDVAYLTSKTIASAPASACTIDGGGIVALSRSNDKPIPYSETQDKNIEGVWYRSLKGNGGACYPGSTGEAESIFASTILNAIRALERVES